MITDQKMITIAPSRNLNGQNIIEVSISRVIMKQKIKTLALSRILAEQKTKGGRAQLITDLPTNSSTTV